jgi:hypothetical protein
MFAAKAYDEALNVNVIFLFYRRTQNIQILSTKTPEKLCGLKAGTIHHG